MLHVKSNLRTILRQVFNTRIQVRRHSVDRVVPNPYVNLPKRYFPPRPPTNRGLDAWAAERSTVLLTESNLSNEAKKTLYRIRDLVGTEQSFLAIALFFQSIKDGHIGGIPEMVHAYGLVIWLFIYAKDLHSAVILLNKMYEYKLPAELTTLMLVCRASESQDPGYDLEAIRNAFLGTLAQLDAGSFCILLDRLGNPHELIFALESYQSLKPPEWIPSPAMYAVIIRSFVRCKNMADARIWLDKYRKSRRKMASGSPSNATTAMENKINDTWASARPLKRFNWDRPLKWNHPGKSYECAPYQAYILGLMDFPESQVEELEKVITQMQEDNIDINVQFYGCCLQLHDHWRLYSDAIVGYKALTASTSPIFLEPPIYTTIFRILYKIISKGGHSYKATELYEIHPRTVFCDMGTLDTARRKSMDNISGKIISSAALSCFLGARDYAAALVVLRFLKKYDYLPHELLRVERSIAKELGFRLSRKEEKTWSDYFFNYRRPRHVGTTKDCLAYVLKKTQGVETKEQIARLEEVLTRALLADMSIEAPWRITVRGDETAEAEIAKATAEMMPSEEAVNSMRERMWFAEAE
ncbi:hypothetical protein M422DRAFT_241058 [Sphaerobolus stellatus SS14]|nr:hypothetical protein M422DRAFT_241058 [Sphaerobolus stellatus SS14]